MKKNRKIKKRMGRLEGNFAAYRKEQEEWKGKMLFRGYVILTAIGGFGFIISASMDYIRVRPLELDWFQFLGMVGFSLIFIFSGTMLGKIVRK